WSVERSSLGQQRNSICRWRSTIALTTWRQNTFEAGKKYRVMKEIQTSTSVFSRGEIVQFREATYSRYDSSTGFVFESEAPRELKTWLLYDADADTSDQLFALVT